MSDRSLPRRQISAIKKLSFPLLALILLWTIPQSTRAVSGAAAEAEPAEAAAPLGAAFTYQGYLELNASAVNGVCDFQFSLWDASSNPSTQIGATQTKTAVSVDRGRFVIPSLDFGTGAFNGDERWLQIAVRCPSGSGSYTILSPRQLLSAAPYATHAAHTPWSGLESVPAGFADGVDNNTTYSAGDGLNLNGTQFSVNYAGSGADPTAARSDHNHWGQTWEGNDFGLTMISTGNFGNSAAIISRIIDNGTGLQGLATPSNSTAGMLVPTGVSGISLLPAGGFSNRTYGVYGQAGGVGGIGVGGYGTYTGTLGIADGTSGKGVYGGATGTGGYGVWGQGPNGMYALSTVSSGNGIIAVANNGTLAFGVWGISSAGYAGYFSGKVNVTGNLTKSGGSFRIDHPLDPEGMYLSHSFVESPDMKNVYDGVVVLDENGAASVTLPEWFESLNRDFRYQLTCIGGYAPVYIASEVQGNSFSIAGGTPGLKVSWQVTGIRQDAWANDNRIQVEEVKPPEEIGTYLYPQGYGQSADLALDAVRMQALEQNQKLPSGETASPQEMSLPPGVWIDWDTSDGVQP